MDAIYKLNGTIAELCRDAAKAPANATADIGNDELYNAYFQAAYEDWTTNEIVGSLAHNLVAAPAFANGFASIIATFQGDRDAESATVNAAMLALQTLR